MPKHLPEETRASAAARAALSANWLDPSAFVDLLRLDGRNDQTLSRLRESGRVFGVWLPEKGAFFYPAWQLTPSSEPAPVLAELLLLLRSPYEGWQGIVTNTARSSLTD
jgi:hypothetical protein